MKLTTCKIAIIFLLLSSLQSFCQEIKTKRWTFLVGSGVAIPVGSYRNDNASSAALYFPEPPNFLLGFDKSKSGFAKTGYYLNAEAQFKLKSGVFFLLRAGEILNTVHTESLSNFLTLKFATPMSVSHEDYTMNYIAPGIGFAKTSKYFDFGFNIFVGYSNCNYPYYQGVYLNSNTNPKIIWAHDGARTSLESLTFGNTFFFRYNFAPRFSVGLECLYQAAQFDYKISNRNIPGGSNIYEIEDTLKIALVNIGISLGYKF